MKIKLISFLLTLAWILAACTTAKAATSDSSNPALAVKADASTAAPTAPADTSNTAPAGNTLKTPIGDLVVTSSRFVQEVNGAKPTAGNKLLLVFLDRPDKTGIDLQQFVDAKIRVFVRDEDGSEVFHTMGGQVEGEFAVGFQVPETFKSYHLILGDNPPQNLSPEE